jgi:cation transport ATPase
MKSEGRRVLVAGNRIHLSAGYASLAMGALGSQIAIEAADMALISDVLHHIPDLFRLCRRSMDVIEQNLVCGAVFIGLAITLSATDWMSLSQRTCTESVRFSNCLTAPGSSASSRRTSDRSGLEQRSLTQITCNS